MKKFMIVLTGIMVVIGGVAIVSDIKVSNKNAEKDSVVAETTTENTTSRNWENEYYTTVTEAYEEESVLSTIAEENYETEKATINSTTKSTTRSTSRPTTKSTTRSTSRPTTKSTTRSTKRPTTTLTTKSTTKTTTRSTTKSMTTVTTQTTTKATTNAYYWRGTKLNRSNGSVEGPSGRETYYNSSMNGVISTAKNKLGLTGEQWYYWERDDGVKMYGQYIICASNSSYHKIGNIVDTTLGKGIILDTRGDYGTIYISVTW